MNDRELMQQALELQALIRKIDAEVKAAGLDTYTAVHNGRTHLIATVRNFLAVATGYLPDWLLQPAQAMRDATELETGNKVEQSAQQHVSVTDELVDAYCKGWEQSFLAGNPYHTVHASEQDKKHIKVGLRAALAEQPAQQHQCSRSHPHENMDAMCELRTEIARLTNENARLKARHQDDEINAYRMTLLCIRDGLQQGMSKSIQKLQAREINDVLGLPSFASYRTSPAASKPWVHTTTWRGLTDDEKRQLFECENYDGWLDYINAIEAKLKEKNA